MINEPKIDGKRLWAFVEKDTGGIVAAMVSGVGAVPLVCASEVTVPTIRKVADTVARMKGVDIELRVFEVVEVLEVFEGKGSVQ